MVAPINLFRGDSPPIAQVTKITPTNPAAGDSFTITSNGKNLTYVTSLGTVADVVAGLVALVTSATIPEFSEFLASASSDGTYLTLTAVTAGVPFAVTTSTTASTAGLVTVTETIAGKFPINEVHIIQLLGTYTGGTFTVTYSFGTTAAIAYNATAATVQAAIAALAGVGVGNVLVTGGPGPSNVWFVTWLGTLGAQVIAPGTINGTNLVGNGSVRVTETQKGNGPSDEIQLVDLTLQGDGTAGVQNGTFTLALDGQVTTNLSPNSSAATVASALAGLPNIGSGNVEVFGGERPSTTTGTIPQQAQYWIVHFKGTLAGTNVSQLVLTIHGMSGSLGQVFTLQNGGQTTADAFDVIDLGGATGGTFTLTINGQTTAPIPQNSATNGFLQQQVATALMQLSSIGSGNVPIALDQLSAGQSGPQMGPVAQVAVAHFMGALANTVMGALSIDGSGLTGSSGATVTRISRGHANLNEIQQVTVFGTGGTFTLTAGAQTTSAIAWNASTATVQTRIQTDLAATFTAVTVTGAGTLASPYVVTVTNPGNTATAVMTGSGASLTGGGGTITEQTAGAAGVNEVQLVSIAPGVGGGTFKLSFQADPTIGIAFNASAATMQTDLVALATINTVTVTGSAGGPWTVTWSGAEGNAPQPLLVPDPSNLTGFTGAQTLGVSTLTLSAGPEHFNNPLNWSLGRVPNSGDAVLIERGSSNCSFGLNQIATFAWTSGTTLQLTGTSWYDLQNGQSVYLTTTNTLPTGLATNTLYYIVGMNNDAGTFSLATTLGGAAITVSGAGAGTHTIGLRLASFELSSRWTGNLGLAQLNGLGYVEYRPQYLHVGFATVAQGGSAMAQTITIGTGQGTGSGLTNIDSDVDQVSVTVITTAGATQQGIPAMLWKGLHPSNVLAVYSGSVGAALFPNESATLGATAPAPALAQRGGSIELGPGVTITGNINKTGGTLQSDNATLNGACVLRG